MFGNKAGAKCGKLHSEVKKSSHAVPSYPDQIERGGGGVSDASLGDWGSGVQISPLRPNKIKSLDCHQAGHGNIKGRKRDATHRVTRRSSMHPLAPADEGFRPLSAALDRRAGNGCHVPVMSKRDEVERARKALQSVSRAVGGPLTYVWASRVKRLSVAGEGALAEAIEVETNSPRSPVPAARNDELICNGGGLRRACFRRAL